MAMEGKGPGQGGGSDDREATFPPEGGGNHRISHETARRMRLRYIEKYGKSEKRDEVLAPGAYDRSIFDRILRDPRCEGIRFYPGIDDSGQMTIMFCGVDRHANDILVGTIGDEPWRCPPMCSQTNGVLQL
jgi:hypothetical protein